MTARLLVLKWLAIKVLTSLDNAEELQKEVDILKKVLLMHTSNYI